MKNIVKEIEKIYKEISIKVLIISFLAFFLIGILFVFVYKQTSVQKFFFDKKVNHDLVIRAPSGNLNVEVADTDTERERGLSYKKSMNEDEGMLFIFDKTGKYGFWMKDMNFSLDILWLDEDGHVVYDADNVPPETYPGILMNDAPAKYVLELNAGEAEKYGIYLGTKLEIGQ